MNQGNHSISIGNQAGRNNQDQEAISIGYESGHTNQGQYSIALGYQAGYSNQHENTIIFNALNSQLNSGNTGSFYVKPIRNVTGETGFFDLKYNPTTGEIGYI